MKKAIVTYSFILLSSVVDGQILIDSTNASKYKVSNAELITGKNDTELIGDFQSGALEFGKEILNRIKERLNLGGMTESLEQKGQKVGNVFGRKEEEEKKKKKE